MHVLSALFDASESATKIFTVGMMASSIARRGVATASTLSSAPAYLSEAPYCNPLGGDAPVLARGACHCGAVAFEATGWPVDAKLCHCRDCQRLHGAPYQWAAIMHKKDIRFTRGLDQLAFYESGSGAHERVLPCKVSCARCRAPIADEGRRMWMAFPPLFDFGHGGPAAVPARFRPTCHIFAGAAVLPLLDDLPKWAGHKGKSPLL